MRRRHLKAIAKRVAEEIERDPEAWRKRTDYPVTWEERTAEGGAVQIEVTRLEEAEEGLYLMISASTGALSACFPAVKTTII